MVVIWIILFKSIPDVLIFNLELDKLVLNAAAINVVSLGGFASQSLGSLEHLLVFSYFFKNLFV